MLVRSEEVIRSYGVILHGLVYATILAAAIFIQPDRRSTDAATSPQR